MEQCTDVGGLLFFMMVFNAFATLFTALFTFPLEFNLLCKVGWGVRHGRGYAWP